MTRHRMTLAALTLAMALTGPIAVHSQPRRVIHITAERFAFTPSQIVVVVDEEIELRLKSDDTAHGFRIAGTGVNVAIPKRGRDELSVLFRPAAPGRYTFECTRMCGAGHGFMRGVLIVRPRTDQ
jgi:cytochrome c oxidase subunit II